jgi:hypothetical protein
MLLADQGADMIRLLQRTALAVSEAVFEVLDMLLIRLGDMAHREGNGKRLVTREH